MLEEVNISPAQLAHRFNLSVTTLERWRKSESGPAFMKIGAKIMYKISDVEQFEMDSRRVSTSAKAKKGAVS